MKDFIVYVKGGTYKILRLTPWRSDGEQQWHYADYAEFESRRDAHHACAVLNGEPDA